MKDRRIGSFRLHRHVIDEVPHAALAVLKDVIVIRAEWMAYGEFCEYHGIHPAFALVPEGALPPFYQAEVTSNGDGSVAKVKWVPA